jgi:murein DD-endopeptidase MepM/ murein hydrolase activator NlpD
MRAVILGLSALALAGCATPTNTVYPRPTESVGVLRPPPSGPNIYAAAPRAPVHGELIACNHGSGSNIGEIGYRSESLAYTPYLETRAGALLRNPTEGACLSSGFGWRGTASGGGRAHNGLDLANANGGFVYAAADGVVTFADHRGGYGNVLEIDHGRGVRTLYAHLSEIDQNIRVGDHVYGGAAVARMGATGNATGVHLHYEVYVDGLLVDPLHYGRPPVYVSAPAPADARIPDDIPALEPSAPYEDEAPKDEALPNDAFVLPPPN